MAIHDLLELNVMLLVFLLYLSYVLLFISSPISSMALFYVTLRKIVNLPPSVIELCALLPFSNVFVLHLNLPIYSISSLTQN